MKAVAMLLLYAGYAVVVYGVDHVLNGCTPFRCVAWPSTTAPCTGSSIPCAGSQSAPSTPQQETVGSGAPGVNQIAPNPDYGIGSRNPYAGFGGNGPAYTGRKLPNPNNAINQEPHPGR